MDEYEPPPPIDQSAAFITEIDPTKPLPIDIEALQALKFESEDPTAAATSYKEEGNYQFKKRKFEPARENYTSGIKAGCTDSEILAQLHTNRAAAEFQLKNFGSCVRDCARAKQLKPDYYRAHERGVRALLALGRHSDAAAWCDEALGRFLSDPELLRLSAEARGQAARAAASARRDAAAGRREDRRLGQVAAALAERGVRVRPGTGQLEMPEAAEVWLDSETGVVHYPVLLLYPEFGQTDFLKDVEETATLNEVISAVLDPSQAPAAWNADLSYTPDTVRLFLDPDRSSATGSGSSGVEAKPPRELEKSLSLARVLKRQEASLTGCVLVLTVLRPGAYADRWLKEWWSAG